MLTRRCGESLRIGAGIRVTILSSASGQVRVGIEAPQRVPVYREEVYERIVEANREAAAVAEDALASLAALRPGSPEPAGEEEEE